MAIAITDITSASRGNYTPASESDTEYVRLKALAKAKLDNDAPEGLPAVIYDQCHALLIVHLYFAGDPKVGMRGFQSGDFSGSQDPGSTTWLQQYNALIVEFSKGSDDELDTTRCDAVMDDLKLDQNDVPSFPG
jgi:hypothetical protein